MKKIYIYVLIAVIFSMIVLNQFLLLDIGERVNNDKTLPEKTVSKEKLNYKPSYVGELGSAHNHADILVLLNGKRVDFSDPKYQLQSYYVHFENNDGEVMHLHAENIDLKFVLETLGISFDKNCIKFEGREFCNNSDQTLKLYVNGEKNEEYENYLVNDLDQILITFGNESEDEIQTQINLVTKRSAIFSRQ